MLKNYKNALINQLFTNTVLVSFFVFPFFKSLSQETIRGKIITEIDNYEEVLVVNATRKTFTHIDTEGAFEINAFLNDTIKVSSNSYEETSFIVNDKHLENSIQISLKDNIENLKEIIIDTNIINDEELKEINLQLQNQIKNDIKNNPYAYTKPNLGGNLFGIVTLVIDLLRKKTPETERAPEVFINHIDLAQYFEKDDSFLINELSIPVNQISYFFLFIEDQQVSAKLLSETNRFFFLEELTRLSNEFFKQ